MGVLNDIRIQFPNKLGEQYFRTQLMDHLFHGLSCNLRDSICYIYKEPEDTYIELLLVAHKAESEDNI